MSGIIDDLRDTVHELYGVRDELGAALKQVYIVEREWSGKIIGEGKATDTLIPVLPSPYIKEYKHDIRIQTGGMIQQGDILLKNISKETFCRKDEVDAYTGAANRQRLYLLDGELHNPVNVEERYFTWEVLVRRTSDQTRYLK